MLQYRTIVESKLTILAYFEEGTAPESENENVSSSKAEKPVVEKYYDNAYVGAYAAYDIEDPTVFYDEASKCYYCFGSDNVVIKSTDLVNWTGRTTYFSTPENANTNAIMDFSYFPSVQAWATTHGYGETLSVSDSKNDRTPLAPEIVKVGSYYYLYFSLTKQPGSNESAIFLAKTKNLAYSIKNKIWYDGGLVISSCGTLSDGTASSRHDPANAVHPSVVFDGVDMYMAYGGYYGNDTVNGSIQLVELDSKTGLLKEDSAINKNGDIISTLHGTTKFNAGTLLAKPGKATALLTGSSSVIGAPELIYNKENGYYYLFMTYGADDTNYNIRVARSKSIEGPYTDFGDNAMNENKGDQYEKGYMLMGGYNFASSATGLVSYTDTGRASTGSPKLIKMADGKWLMACQSQLYYKVDSRVVTGSAIAEKEGVTVSSEPCLDIREILFDSSGWPVAMPETFSGDYGSASFTDDELLGNWDVLVFDRTADKKDYRAVARNVSGTVSVFKNGVVTALDIEKNKPFEASTGFKRDGSVYKIIIDGVEYKIYPRYMWDWELQTGSLVFTGIGANGSTIWGKKNFSGTKGVYTDAFYYLYNQCDETTKLTVDAKVKKFSANPTQSHVDVLSSAIIAQLIKQQAAAQG